MGKKKSNKKVDLDKKSEASEDKAEEQNIDD